MRMKYQSLEDLRKIHKPPFDIEGILSQCFAAESQNGYLFRIVVALTLLGNGFVDEGHNLILRLSWRGDLSYAYGPPPTLTEDTIPNLASYAHCLVHRREGPHDSEFGMTGYRNSDYWAGTTLRSLDKALPLEKVKYQVHALARCWGPEAQLWIEGLNKQEENWDPRYLTELCAQVQAQKGHSLTGFAEQAAILELQTLLNHVLIMIGYQVDDE